MKILITGGAGFVGSAMARFFSENKPQSAVTVMDNLKRRGSEINVADFVHRGISFRHGDVRCPEDFFDLGGSFDLVIDASAEPSVHAGLAGSPDYMLHTNLNGTLNLLNYSRNNAGHILFLSTSRVYSLKPLQQIALSTTATRFEIDPEQSLPGISSRGISEQFPVHLPRSFYGASKLASEMLIQEYCNAYGMKAVINRCGVIAGSGQFGKTDQGVFTLWVMNHIFNKPLSYTGFGGTGKQVRDIIHPLDLCRLVQLQLENNDVWCGEIFNVGGGLENSVSMFEMTELCRSVTGREITVNSSQETSPFDVPLYISDNSNVSRKFKWFPEIQPEHIVKEIADWVDLHRTTLESLGK